MTNYNTSTISFWYIGKKFTFFRRRTTFYPFNFYIYFHTLCLWFYSWLPNYVTLLAQFITEPYPTRSTVTKTVAEFKRSHADTWDIQKNAFTEEQLEASQEFYFMFFWQFIYGCRLTSFLVKFQVLANTSLSASYFA